MNTQMKIILALAAALLMGVAVASLVSSVKIRSLERSVESAKQQAKTSEEAAAAAEIRAAEYKEKTEYLEKQIAENQAMARRIDEELEKIGGDVGAARRNVSNARGKRGASANVDELCRKLGELGYPCER